MPEPADRSPRPAPASTAHHLATVAPPRRRPLLLFASAGAWLLWMIYLAIVAFHH